MANYVKFQRGSQAAYDRLKSQSRLDDNTLYFIYESVDANVGSLYMGDKLISSGAGATNQISISNLSDIELGDNLSDKVLLTYDANSEKWKPISLEDAIEEADISFPAQIQVVSVEKADGQNDSQALSAIENPVIGDIAFVDDKPYVYNGEEWKALSNPEVENNISILQGAVGDLEELLGQASAEGSPASGLYAVVENLQSQLDSVPTYDDINSAVLAAVDGANHLKYEIIDNIGEAIEENVIYLIAKADSSNNNNIYDEYMYFPAKDNVEAHVEKIGDWTVDLSNYVEKVDGSRLINQEEIDKLAALTLVEGDLEISGKVDAENVNGLEDLVSDMFDTKVGDLSSLYVLKSVFDSTIGDLNNLNDRIKENSSLVDEINAINERLTWGDMPELQ